VGPKCPVPVLGLYIIPCSFLYPVLDSAVEATKPGTKKAAITSKIKHAIKLAIKLKIIAATTSNCNKT